MINLLIAFVIIFVLWSVWGFFSSRVEQALYTVTKKMDGYEIREYPEHIVAQTTVEGSYQESMSNGFRIVAGYIFGGNTKNTSIAMTAPVVLQQEKSKKGYSQCLIGIELKLKGIMHMLDIMPHGLHLG